MAAGDYYVNGLKVTADGALYVNASVAGLNDATDVTKGDALVAVKRQVVGSVATTVHDWIEGQVLNVKTDFGAVGDGVTDDSAAILACVNAAASASSSSFSNRSAVYFPPGIYKIGTSGCLTPNAVTSIKGLYFLGAGKWTSILRLAPSGTDIYFYDNVATARMQQSHFEHLGFEGLAPSSFAAYTDISDNAKGFRLWSTTASGSWEQNFIFHACRFDYLATVFEMRGGAGGNTASENSWSQCYFNHIKNALLDIDNPQSLNHEFHGCNYFGYGDVFSVVTASGGGGAIKVFGGSWIQDSAKATDIFVVNQTASAGVNTYPFTFTGIRFEHRGNNAKLTKQGTGAGTQVEWNDCLFFTTATSNLTDWASTFSGRIYFNGCTFRESSTGQYLFGLKATTRTYNDGLIEFINCGVPSSDWSDRISFANREGHARGRGLHTTDGGAISTPTHYAMDFDCRADITAGQVGSWSGADATTQIDGGNYGGANLPLKTALIKLWSEAWPDATEATLKLPRNAIIKNIHLRKPANGADNVTVTFRIGRLDKSGTDHLVSNTDAHKNSHTGDVMNYFYCVGTTTNERTLILYTAENPVATINGGFALVEYY